MSPETTHRYKEFLENYHFYANSVDFRIVSSKALEKWKNVQSFQLNQVTNGRFFFPQDRRETLLLKYDLWSRWLYEVENLMIELGGKHESIELQNHDIDIIISLAEKTAKCYEEIIEEEGTHFNSEFSRVWIEVHNDVFQHMLKKIRQMKGSYSSVFVQIVDLLVEIMQYTLTEIHELNHIILKRDEDYFKQEPDTIFLVVTPFCLSMHENTDQCLITHRIKIYQKYFKFDTIYLKNYTDNTLPSELFERIESCGVHVDLKKSLFN